MIGGESIVSEILVLVVCYKNGLEIYYNCVYYNRVDAMLLKMVFLDNS
jgi:hypothetical protein